MTNPAWECCHYKDNAYSKHCKNKFSFIRGVFVLMLCSEPFLVEDLPEYLHIEETDDAEGYGTVHGYKYKYVDHFK